MDQDVLTNNHISYSFPKHIIRTGNMTLEIHAVPDLEQAQQYYLSKYCRQSNLQTTKYP